MQRGSVLVGHFSFLVFSLEWQRLQLNKLSFKLSSNRPLWPSHLFRWFGNFSAGVVTFPTKKKKKKKIFCWWQAYRLGVAKQNRSDRRNQVRGTIQFSAGTTHTNHQAMISSFTIETHTQKREHRRDKISEKQQQQQQKRSNPGPAPV